jgi:hypothetical protein
MSSQSVAVSACVDSSAVALPLAPKADWLLALILVLVLFTPTFRLPGGIPMRLDDVVIFVAGAILALSWLATIRVPRPDSVSVYLTLLILTTLLSSVVAANYLGFEITAKEYLDILRPLKFLALYWIVKEQDCRSSLHTFLKTMSIAMGILLVVAVLEMIASRIAGDGLLIRAFTLFADTSTADEAREAMTQRPFATFNTPTHLGYVATLGMFLSPLFRAQKQRRFMVVLSFMVLLISVTRTLLFALPILLVLQALTRGKSLRERLKSLRSAAIFVLLFIVIGAVLLPLISPVAADYTGTMIQSIITGNTEDEYSITTRLSNLVLASYTWDSAPVLGVATRAMLPDYVDSEVILTFHRYGALGLGMLFAIYPIGIRLARRASHSQPLLSQFAIVALAVTFLYGITQGALINSRIGVIPFVVFGMLEGYARQEGNAGTSQTVNQFCEAPGLQAFDCEC